MPACLGKTFEQRSEVAEELSKRLAISLFTYSNK
jgi:hypothetical protein